MKTIEAKAQAVAEHLTENNVPQIISPIMILTIVEIIIELVKLAKSCNQTPKEALGGLKKPGPFERLATRRIVRKRLATLSQWRQYGTQFTDGIFAVGGVCTEDEVSTMFQEAV